MSAEVYRKLAEHLDRLPDGFPPSETGAELRLLQRLFTPEEAALATCLTLERADAQAIAARAGLPLPEAARRLEEMTAKGLILAIRQADGPTLYQALPWVVGIYEFQVNNLTPELRKDLRAYWSTQKRRSRPRTIRQMRIIPVGTSIEPTSPALPYEQVYAIVQANDRFAVSPCICRRHARLEGHGCDAPEESCLILGDWADATVQGGRGRYVDRAEMLQLLARADAANLVLEPSNTQDVAFICCCCGCCCGVLQGLKSQPKPAEAANSPFVAQLDAEICQGCWTCLKRCQMEAVTEDGEHVALNADRCIGCGLCVTTCPSGALTLVRTAGRVHAEMPVAEIPATMDALWHVIAQAQNAE